MLSSVSRFFDDEGLGDLGAMDDMELDGGQAPNAPSGVEERDSDGEEEVRNDPRTGQLFSGRLRQPVAESFPPLGLSTRAGHVWRIDEEIRGRYEARREEDPNDGGDQNFGPFNAKPEYKLVNWLKTNRVSRDATDDLLNLLHVEFLTTEWR